MAQCNLFRPMKPNRSNFYLFSQYGDDLTKEYTQKDFYRVVPSRFAAMNLTLNTVKRDDEQYKGFIETVLNDEQINTNSNVSSFENIVKQKTGEQIGHYLVLMLQNYYENRCAFLRHKYASEHVDWTPDDATAAFWDTLKKYNLIHTGNGVNDSSNVAEIYYCGDINIYANDASDDGLNYNEIFCVIPSNVQRTTYRLKRWTKEISARSFPYNTENVNSQNEAMLFGFTDDTRIDFGLEYELNVEGIRFTDIENQLLTYNVDGYMLDRNDDDTFIATVDTNNTKFTFNSIVVFYDIIDKENNVKYHNVPMGIYFCGMPENVVEYDDKGFEKIKFAFQNEITHYYNNEDIYNNGTSYTLRICTRYLTTQNATMFSGVEVAMDNNYASYSSVMQTMGDTIDIVKQYMHSNNSMYADLRSHLAQFKNHMTNVPYIREASDGTKHWFVNGRDTNVIAQYEYDYSTMLLNQDNGRSLIIKSSMMPEDKFMIRYDETTDVTSIRNLDVENALFIDNVTIDDYVKSIQKDVDSHTIIYEDASNNETFRELLNFAENNKQLKLSDVLTQLIKTVYYRPLTITKSQNDVIDKIIGRDINETLTFTYDVDKIAQSRQILIDENVADANDVTSDERSMSLTMNYDNVSFEMMNDIKFVASEYDALNKLVTFEKHNVVRWSYMWGVYISPTQLQINEQSEINHYLFVADGIDVIQNMQSTNNDALVADVPNDACYMYVIYPKAYVLLQNYDNVIPTILKLRDNNIAYNVAEYVMTESTEIRRQEFNIRKL